MKLITRIFFFLSAMLLLLSCKKDTVSQTDNLYKFKEYISYHTTGVQSIAEPIRIELSKKVPQFELSQEIPSEYLKITPNIKGRLVIEAQKSLIFFPDEKLQPDTEYQVTLQLHQLFEDLPGDFRHFSFSFKTITPDFKINLGSLQSYDKDWQRLSVSIEASDVLDPIAVKKI